MILAGVNQRHIARKLNVSDAAVSANVRGIKTSTRIRAEIATRLGKSPQQLWPPLKPHRGVSE
ncbi:MAG: hypothetical protein WC421_02925 [Elusimicrobiales bacterium]